jgi:hypothetical protein
LLILRCRLPPLGIVQQQPRGDFPFLLSRRPEVPIEILGRDRRQSLRPVRQFPGDAEIVKGRKPVPQRNRFRTATRIAWGTRKILTEFSFRAKPNFGAAILRRHAESRPLRVSAQRFSIISQIDQLLRGAGLRYSPQGIVNANQRLAQGSPANRVVDKKSATCPLYQMIVDWPRRVGV